MEQLKQRVQTLQDEVSKAQHAAEQAQKTVELHGATEALTASDWQERLQQGKASQDEQGPETASQRAKSQKKKTGSSLGSWEDAGAASWSSWTKPTASAVAALGALESRPEAGSVASSQQSKSDKVGVARARLLHCAENPQTRISYPAKAALSIYDCLILLWDFEQNRPDHALAGRQVEAWKATALKKVVGRRKVAFYAAAMKCAVSLTQPMILSADGRFLKVDSDRVTLEQPGALAAFVQGTLLQWHTAMCQDRDERNAKDQKQEMTEEQEKELKEQNSLLRPRAG